MDGIEIRTGNICSRLCKSMQFYSLVFSANASFFLADTFVSVRYCCSRDDFVDARGKDFTKAMTRSILATYNNINSLGG